MMSTDTYTTSSIPDNEICRSPGTKSAKQGHSHWASPGTKNFGNAGLMVTPFRQTEPCALQAVTGLIVPQCL